MHISDNWTTPRDPATRNYFNTAIHTLDDALNVVRASTPPNLTPAEVKAWQLALNAGELWKMPADFTSWSLYFIERGILERQRRTYSARKAGPIAGLIALIACATIAQAQQVLRIDPNGNVSIQSPCQLGGRAVDCSHFTTSDPAQEAARQEWIQQRHRRHTNEGR